MTAHPVFFCPQFDDGRVLLPSFTCLVFSYPLVSVILYLDSSMTGVCFTRNPNNGQKEFFGEYLVNAQGEDVVAGIRTPKHISEMKVRPLLSYFSSMVEIIR
jgi:hypothetical protein